MPFEKGHKKVGGRKVGSPNKKWADITPVLSANKFDPMSKLMELLPKLDLERQAHICLNLMPYVYPKVKSQEQEKEDLKSMTDEDLANCLNDYLQSNEQKSNFRDDIKK